MMDVSADTWRTLSTLLDEALDHAPEQRAAWLARVGANRPDLVPLLEKLLSAHSAAETDDLLARPPALPTLPGDLAAPASSRSDAEPAAGQRVGPYVLRRPLGAGGMADVWLAQRDDGQLTRAVALKLPRIGLLRRDLAQRFARERDILARLEHPHIARLYDAGVSEDGLPYLAMEFVDGAPVNAHCDAQRLGVDARLRLFAQILDAVRYAHANLVIHRDLKPSNILVTAQGQARLLDFGIAKLLAGDTPAQETHLTQAGGRALTPDYASPEQVRGQPLTTATDVYSLGVVLYELLSGKRPYRLKVPSVAQLEQAILSTDPARPSSMIETPAADARGTTVRALTRELAGDLDTIVMKALAKSPADRYGTIAEFADDLERYCAGLPVRAQPAAFSYRARKFVARNRLAVAASTAIVLAVAVGAALAAWQARQAQREAAKSTAVKEFLTDLFRANALEPADAARRRALTAGQLLEEGAVRLGTHFQDQPVLKAELQGVVGGLLHELALNDQALAMRRERLALLEQTAAPALDRAEARRDVADTLAQKGDGPGAARELQTAIDLLDASGNSDDPLRWTLLSAAARLSLDDNRADAERKMQMAADALARVAPGSVAHAEALVSLGEVQGAANRTDQALALFNQALPLLEQRLGPRSMALAVSRSRVAHSLTAQRRDKEAGAQLQAALATLEEVAGKEHPVTVGVRIELGRSLTIVGEPAKGRALLAEAVTVLARRNDISPQLHAEALLYLGESYLDEGRVDAAGAPLEDALQRLRADADQDTLTVARLIYARYLLDAGRYAAAETELVAARDRQIALLGADHPVVATVTNRIGLVQFAAGRTQDAAATFRSVLGSQENREHVFGSAKHLAAMNLAQIDMEQQRFDAALPTIRQSLALFEALPPEQRGRIPELSVKLRLARALVGTGALDEAGALLPRIAELAAPFYEHAPLRITEHLLRARYFGARRDAPQAHAELAQARASLRAQPALGAHFDRQIGLAERELAALLK